MSAENNIGKTINEFVLVNIQIWHEATKIKNLKGTLCDKSTMPLEKRVSCALKTRGLNAERSKLRWEVDKCFGSGANEAKVFSKGG